MGTLILTAAGIYVLIVGVMVLFQNHLLFLPSAGMSDTPERTGLAAEDVWIETGDGPRLHGWYFPAGESDRIVVFSHGNAGNISGRLGIAETLLKTGVAVLMYDYRGYGKSEGRPSEQGFYRDVEGVIEYLKEEKGYSEHQMIMYGRSLGGAVAAYAAVTYRPAGLVLDSAFTNLKRMVHDLYPFIPARLARYEFPTLKYVRQLRDLPVMILHSPEDEVVGYHHGEHLYREAGKPKRFVKLRGGHNDTFFQSREVIEESWDLFLNEIYKAD